MRFTNGFLVAWMILLSACFSGCSSTSEKSSSDKKAAASTVEVNGAQALSILPAGEPTPNPYLQNVPSVGRGVQQQFNDAVSAMQQKNWSQAERILLQFTREQARLSGGHLNLGLVYRALNNPEKAEQAFAAAIASNSKNLDAYNQLAILKRQTGDFTAAEVLYQEALTIWPFHPDSHKNIGILYDLYLGKEGQALAHYQAYKQLTGDADKQLDGWIADLQRRLAKQGGG
jgi:tetratricopeptide (TPR) repeat protein